MTNDKHELQQTADRLRVPVKLLVDTLLDYRRQTQEALTMLEAEAAYMCKRALPDIEQASEPAPTRMTRQPDGSYQPQTNFAPGNQGDELTITFPGGDRMVFVHKKVSDMHILEICVNNQNPKSMAIGTPIIKLMADWLKQRSEL